MPVQVQLRRGSTSQWSTANPTLAAGEVGVDTTLTKFKVGNGSTAWNSLGYVTLTFQGAYAGGTTYYPSDVVTYSGATYICILESVGNLPTNETYFSVLALKGDTGATGAQGDTGATGATGPQGPAGTSFTFQGAWSSATSYVVNDVVVRNSQTYISIQSGVNQDPETQTTYWTLMAAKGANGEVSLNGVETLTNKTISASNNTLIGPDGATQVGYISAPQSNQSGSTYTLALTDAGKHVWFTGGSTATLTVPTNASAAFSVGTTILVLNNNSDALTISGAGVTFQLAAGTTGNRTVAAKGMASLLKVDTNTWWVTGPGVS